MATIAESQTKTWQKMKLGEIAQDIRDPYLPTKAEEKPYIGLEHIEQQTLQLSGVGKSNETQSAKKIFQSGDILFGTLRPYFRKVTRPKFDGVCSTDIAVIRPTKKGAGVFLKYFIANQDFIDYASNISSGTRMPRANWKTLKETIWLLPELNEQNVIGDVLSTYDDLIENNTRRIKILEEIAQAIYREWFVYFRFPGHEKAKSRSERSSATGIKMIDSKTEFGKIPEGWAVKGLDEDLEVVLGGTPSRANSEYWNGDVPWINSSETNHLRVITPSEFITKKGLDNSAAKLMPKRTTVLAITGATLGQVSLLEIECSANQSVVGIYDKNAIYNEYLYLFISDKIDDIISKSGGSAQQHINKKIVEEYQILVPPKKEIDEFNKAIKPIFNLLSDLLFSNQKLRQARDLLLPKLVTGEIVV